MMEAMREGIAMTLVEKPTSGTMTDKEMITVPEVKMEVTITATAVMTPSETMAVMEMMAAMGMETVRMATAKVITEMIRE